MQNRSFELPKFDMPAFKGVAPETMMATQRRSMDAMQSAAQILADGARTFGQRQSEIMQARMSEFQARAEAMMKADPKAPALDARIEEAKSTYEQALADTRELIEIVTKAQADALHVWNQCLLANLEDMKKMAG